MASFSGDQIIGWLGAGGFRLCRVSESFAGDQVIGWVRELTDRVLQPTGKTNPSTRPSDINLLIGETIRRKFVKLVRKTQTWELIQRRLWLRATP